MNLLSVAAAYGVLVDGVPVRLVRRPARLRLARLREHDDAAVPARDRVRPVDGLRGVPAVAHPRALRRHRRHAQAPSPRASRASAAHDLERGADHGRGVRACSPAPACRRSRRSALGWRWRSRSTRRSSGSSSCPATMELMGKWNWWLPRRAGPRAAARRLRVGLRPRRAGARSRPLARSRRSAPARACRGRGA